MYVQSHGHTYGERPAATAGESLPGSQRTAGQASEKVGLRLNQLRHFCLGFSPSSVQWIIVLAKKETLNEIHFGFVITRGWSCPSANHGDVVFLLCVTYFLCGFFFTKVYFGSFSCTVGQLYKMEHCVLQFYCNVNNISDDDDDDDDEYDENDNDDECSSSSSSSSSSGGGGGGGGGGCR